LRESIRNTINTNNNQIIYPLENPNYAVSAAHCQSDQDMVFYNIAPFNTQELQQALATTPNKTLQLEKKRILALHQTEIRRTRRRAEIRQNDIHLSEEEIEIALALEKAAAEANEEEAREAEAKSAAQPPSMWQQHQVGTVMAARIAAARQRQQQQREQERQERQEESDEDWA